VLDQVVEQATSLALRITAPIADKDAGQLAIPYGTSGSLNLCEGQLRFGEFNLASLGGIIVVPPIRLPAFFVVPVVEQ
jgi:hypothetical protein